MLRSSESDETINKAKQNQKDKKSTEGEWTGGRARVKHDSIDIFLSLHLDAAAATN